MQDGSAAAANAPSVFVSTSIRTATPLEIIGVWQIMPDPRKVYRYRYVAITGDGRIGWLALMDEPRQLSSRFVIGSIAPGKLPLSQRGARCNEMIVQLKAPFDCTKVMEFERYWFGRYDLLHIGAANKHVEEFFIFKIFQTAGAVETVQGIVQGNVGDLLMGQVYIRNDFPLDYDHLRRLPD
jgi:hypothetical protein